MDTQELNLCVLPEKPALSVLAKEFFYGLAFTGSITGAAVTITSILYTI